MSSHIYPLYIIAALLNCSSTIPTPRSLLLLVNLCCCEDRNMKNGSDEGHLRLYNCQELLIQQNQTRHYSKLSSPPSLATMHCISNCSSSLLIFAG